MATNAELQAKVVSTGLTRKQKNSYTQGAKRTQVGTGWSDCSSFVRWCYLQVIGKDIGGNTAAQIVNKNLTVADKNGKAYPDEKNLQLGDLLYFKGSDASRPLGVGHVEMYIGKGQLLGHGSGIGPTVKTLKTYCQSRWNSGRGYLRTLRVIGSDFYKGDNVPDKLGEYALYEGMSNSKLVKELQGLLISAGYGSFLGADQDDGDYGPKTASAVTKFQIDAGLISNGTADVATIKALVSKVNGVAETVTQKIEIKGGTCYVRLDPNLDGPILGVAKSGTIFESTGRLAEGWNGVWWETGDGKTSIGAWVSQKYSEVVL